jgi:hypothetical protein
MARSVLAVVAGLVFIFLTHLGTDQVLHVLGVFPPWGQPMNDPALNLLALSYRVVLSVAGCALAARLAPDTPFAHAELLGIIGTVLSALGVYAATTADLGPIWYPLALMVSSIPCGWAGGWLVQRSRR